MRKMTLSSAAALLLSLAGCQPTAMTDVPANCGAPGQRACTANDWAAARQAPPSRGLWSDDPSTNASAWQEWTRAMGCAAARCAPLVTPTYAAPRHCETHSYYSVGGVPQYTTDCY